jgi:hypothetical protein
MNDTSRGTVLALVARAPVGPTTSARFLSPYKSAWLRIALFSPEFNQFFQKFEHWPFFFRAALPPPVIEVLFEHERFCITELL